MNFSTAVASTLSKLNFIPLMLAAGSLPEKSNAKNPYHYEGAADLKSAQKYCRHIVHSNKENFLVTSICCPKPLRHHLYNIYSFTRIADDLSDETEDSAEALELLAWWREELDALYCGKPKHPVFVALADTVQRFGIPKNLFSDMIDAYVQDHFVREHRTFEDLLAYCRKSLAPIGRLILYVNGYTDPESLALSETCWIGVQLADFWNDLADDIATGRHYLPLEDCERFGVTEEMLAKRSFTPEFAALMKFQVERTRALFAEGNALYALIGDPARKQIVMYERFGLAVLDNIERKNYDVLTNRPSLSAWTKFSILFQTVFAAAK